MGGEGLHGEDAVGWLDYIQDQVGIVSEISEVADYLFWFQWCRLLRISETVGLSKYKNICCNVSGQRRYKDKNIVSIIRSIYDLGSDVFQSKESHTNYDLYNFSS